MTCLTKSFIAGTSIVVILALTLVLIPDISAYNHVRNVRVVKPSKEIQRRSNITAARILSTMDQTADPCNDFYQYSCGGWLKNVDPSINGSVEIYQNSLDNVDLVLKQELENVDKKSSSTSVEKAKKFYSSCMNNQTRNSGTAEKNMINFVRNTLKGWPMASDPFDDNFSKNFDYASTLYNFAYNANTRSVIDIGTTWNIHNNKEYMIVVDQPDIDEQLVLRSTFNYEFYKKHATVQKQYKIDLYKYLYIKYLTKTAKRYCVISEYNNCDEATIKKDAEAVYALENDIASIMVSKSEWLSTVHDLSFANHKTISEFESQYGFIGTLVKDLLMDLYKDVQPAIDDSTYIYDSSESYFSKLGKVIKSADPKVIQNMLVFRALNLQKITLPDVYINEDRIYRNPWNTTLTHIKPYEICVALTLKAMVFPVGSLYVEKAFTEESKEKISEMIDLVEKNFKGPILDEATWMDDSTKSKAEIKADKVMNYIGYPSYIVNDKPKMDRDYGDFDVDEKDLFANLLRVD